MHEDSSTREAAKEAGELFSVEILAHQARAKLSRKLGGKGSLRGARALCYMMKLEDSEERTWLGRGSDFGIRKGVLYGETSFVHRALDFMMKSPRLLDPMDQPAHLGLLQTLVPLLREILAIVELFSNVVHSLEAYVLDVSQKSLVMA